MSMARAVAPALRKMWTHVAPRLDAGQAIILSGATGAEPATAGERAFLAEHDDIPVRATGSYIGHGLEPSFPMNIALAALTLSHADAPEALLARLPSRSLT